MHGESRCARHNRHARKLSPRSHRREENASIRPWSRSESLFVRKTKNEKNRAGGCKTHTPGCVLCPDSRRGGGFSLAKFGEPETASGPTPGGVEHTQTGNAPKVAAPETERRTRESLQVEAIALLPGADDPVTAA